MVVFVSDCKFSESFFIVFLSDFSSLFNSSYFFNFSTKVKTSASSSFFNSFNFFVTSFDTKASFVSFNTPFSFSSSVKESIISSY